MNLSNPTTFQYKGKAYSFSTCEGVPLEIEPVLKAIDDGRVAKALADCPKATTVFYYSLPLQNNDASL